jgi:transglutaminase-like putative cysteine protease
VLLNIRHRTTYRYARPIGLLPHRIMLCPRGKYDLKLISTSLSTTPAGSTDWTQDVFGNLIATVTFSGLTDSLVIDSELVVEQSAAAWPVFFIAPSAHSYPFTYAPDDIIDLGALLHPDEGAAGQIVGDWVRRSLAAVPTDTLSLLQAINERIHREFIYRWRDEEGTQSAAETIAQASGSCRDLATLFVDAMRHIGIGARIVSGYLFDGAAEEQHGATHAWAEAYLPCAGWIAFDPTNARMGSADLVPVAVGRAISQIMPVSGSYDGTPDDFIDMDVDVTVKRTD